MTLIAETYSFKSNCKKKTPRRAALVDILWPPSTELSVLHRCTYKTYICIKNHHSHPTRPTKGETVNSSIHLEYWGVCTFSLHSWLTLHCHVRARRNTNRSCPELKTRSDQGTMTRFHYTDQRAYCPRSLHFSHERTQKRLSSLQCIEPSWKSTPLTPLTLDTGLDLASSGGERGRPEPQNLM